MAIGDRIKERRKELGLTQEKLGEFSGVNPVQIRRYESNKQIPKISILQKIANALEIDFTELLKDQNIIEYNRKSIVSAIEKIYKNDDLIVELITDFNKLNDDGKKVAADRIKELTELKRYRKK